MALTINPTVSGRPRSWRTHAGMFFAGAVVGAMGSVGIVLTAAALVAIVAGVGAIRVTALVLVTCALLRDIGLPAPVPYRRRQVPERWRTTMPPSLSSLLYGAALGFGFATPFVSSAHLAALAALPFLQSNAPIAAIVILTAIGKSITLVVGIGSTTQDEVRLRTSLEAGSVPRWFSRRVVSICPAFTVLVLMAQIPA